MKFFIEVITAGRTIWVAVLPSSFTKALPMLLASSFTLPKAGV
jgi:hypothetical protein